MGTRLYTKFHEPRSPAVHEMEALRFTEAANGHFISKEDTKHEEIGKILSELHVLRGERLPSELCDLRVSYESIRGKNLWSFGPPPLPRGPLGDFPSLFYVAQLIFICCVVPIGT